MCAPSTLLTGVSSFRKPNFATNFPSSVIVTPSVDGWKAEREPERCKPLVHLVLEEVGHVICSSPVPSNRQHDPDHGKSPHGHLPGGWCRAVECGLVR